MPLGMTSPHALGINTHKHNILVSSLKVVDMKFFLELVLVLAFFASSSSLIVPEPQQEEEVNISGCFAPTNGRATFTVMGQQGVKGDPGPEGPQGLRGDRGVRGRKGEKGMKGDEGVGLTGPLVVEATQVLTVYVDRKAPLVHQVQEDSQVHQECL